MSTATVDTGHAAWLEGRRSAIGSSDVAAVVGASKWDGPLTVYASKVYGYDKPVTDAMDIGTFMEPWVIGKFASLHPDLAVVAKPGVFVGEKPWHKVTPDALAGRPLTRPHLYVEAKTATRRGEDAEEGWGEPGTDEVPFDKLIQVTWGCRIVGCREWVIPVLFEGRVFAQYFGTYSPTLGDVLAERVDAYWHDHVEARIEPPADGFDSTRLMLASRHHAAKKSEGQLPFDALTWAAEYDDLREQAKDIKAEMAKRANLLRQAHVAAACQLGYVHDVHVSTLTRAVNGVVSLTVKDQK